MKDTEGGSLREREMGVCNNATSSLFRWLVMLGDSCCALLLHDQSWTRTRRGFTTFFSILPFFILLNVNISHFFILSFFTFCLFLLLLLKKTKSISYRTFTLVAHAAKLLEYGKSNGWCVCVCYVDIDGKELTNGPFEIIEEKEKSCFIWEKSFYIFLPSVYFFSSWILLISVSCALWVESLITFKYMNLYILDKKTFKEITTVVSAQHKCTSMYALRP